MATEDKTREGKRVNSVGRLTSEIKAIIDQSPTGYSISASEMANSVGNLPQLDYLDLKVLARALILNRLLSSYKLTIETVMAAPDKYFTDIGILLPPGNTKMTSLNYRYALKTYYDILQKSFRSPSIPQQVS